jgi:hypothetical protein
MQGEAGGSKLIVGVVALNIREEEGGITRESK